MTINRRTFLSGCASVCFLNGMQLSVSRTAWANNSSKPKLLVYVFLRGGIDGLNFICPVGGQARAKYEEYRPYIAVPRKGQANGVVELADDWGINPSAASLKEIWDDKNLAIVHACGMPKGFSTRSHFDAQKYLERGITANASQSTFTGWLGRYLNGVSLDNASLPAASIGTETESLLGFNRRVSVNALEGFSPMIYGHELYGKSYFSMIEKIYSQQETMDLSVKASMDLVDTLTAIDPNDYLAPKGVNYPKNSSNNLLPISKDFRRVAQLLRVKPDLGVHAATINVGGWDTHNAQGNDGQGYYGTKLKELSNAISAFYQEMQAVGLGDSYTMVIQSEFGRRARENNDRGTDHGTGNPLLVIGQSVKGGKFYGTEPDLANLFQNQDIAVSSDYRKVLREMLGKDFQVSGSDLSQIFPAYTDNSTFGLFDGDINEKYIFSSSFE